jgi:uncharacterized membrane protein
MIKNLFHRPIAVSAILLFFAIIGAGLWAAAQLPPDRQIATHFTADGTPNGWMTPLKALSTIPALTIVTAGIITLLHWRLNRSRPIAATQQSADLLIFATLLVMATVQCVIIANALSFGWDHNRILALGLGATWLLMGNVMGKLRPNPVAGIRTPWTLADDEIWDKTHRFGGWAFVLAGFVTLSGAMSQRHLPLLAWSLPAFVAGGLSVARSWQLWRELHPGESLPQTRRVTTSLVMLMLAPLPLLIVAAQKLGWIAAPWSTRMLLGSVMLIVIAAAFRSADR